MIGLVFSACGTRSNEPVGPDPDSIVALVIEPDSVRLPVGDTLRLSARLLLASGATRDAESVVWSTASAQVLQVDGAALVQALRAGRGRVDAAAAGLTASASVTVPGWFTTSPLPQPIRSGHVAAVDGKIYYMGGNNGSDYSAASYSFDAESESWSSALPPLPTARDHAAFATTGGRVYIIGGINPNAPNNGLSRLWVNEAFDVGASTWLPRQQMPTARGGARADTLGGLIYVMAGTTVQTDYDTVEVYDPAMDTWSAAPSMPTKRWNFAAASIGGKIYVAGGEVSSNVPTGSVEIYDPATGWSAGPPMLVARYRAAWAVLEDRLWVIGGKVSTGPPVTVVESFDPMSGRWEPSTPMPEPRSDIRAAVVDGVIYVMGGLTASGETDRVEGFVP